MHCIRQTTKNHIKEMIEKWIQLKSVGKFLVEVVKITSRSAMAERPRDA